MFCVKKGVVKLFPVASIVLLVGAAYQLIVPIELIAVIVVVPGPQLDEGFVLTTVGTRSIVAVMAVLVKVVQLFAVAST